MQRVIDLEMNNRDFTLPGHSYMGPGTRVVTNLVNDVKPTDYMDTISLEHDIDYVFAETMADIREADKLYGDQAKGLEGLLAHKALETKNAYDDLMHIMGKSPVDSRYRPLNKPGWDMSADEIQAIADLLALRKNQWAKQPL